MDGRAERWAGQLGRNLTIDWLAVNAGAGRYADIPKPAWAMPLLVIAIVTLAVSAIPVFIELEEHRRRWVYWGAYLSGTLLMAVALSYRGWRVSAEVCVAGICIAVCFAFFYDRSLIKIGGREISYMLPHQRAETGDMTDAQQPAAPPADSYLGAVSARNHWWVVAIGTGVLSYDVYLFGRAWQSALIIAFAVACAALSGSDDGRRGLPTGRGQKVQFAIASLASVGMFTLPLLAYLAAYFTAKKWPATAGRHALGHDPGENRESG